MCVGRRRIGERRVEKDMYIRTYIRMRGEGGGTLAVYDESRGEKRIRRDREVRYSMCREKEGRREMGGNRVHTYVNVERRGRN